MNYTLTTNLTEDKYHFLQKMADKKKTTKRKILEEALEFYEKMILEQEIKNWFEKNYSEYQSNLKEFENLQSDSIKWI